MKYQVDLISVLMPVYNVIQFVEEAIDSILNQTYRNVELIIIDDASSDGTYELILSKYGHDNRVVILRNSTNMKIVYSLNRGLSVAKGSFIARIDGDDIAFPDRLERQIDFLYNNKDIDLVGCNLVSIDSNGNLLHNNSYFPSNFETLKIIAKYSPPVSHIWLCRRVVYDALKGYRFPTVEDYDFLLRMITEGYKFSNLSNYTGMKIRIRDGSTASLYGVYQRKAFNFVRKLYFQRLKFSKEIIAADKFNEYVSNDSFVKLHSFSNKICKMAMLQNKKLLKFSLLILAALLSPYQAQYFFYRFRVKTIIAKSL